MRRFGDRLDELLKAKGWSQSDLARKVHIEPARISQCVRHIKPPSKGMEAKWGKALGLKDDELSDFVALAKRERFFFKKDVGPLFFAMETRVERAENDLRSAQALLRLLLEKMGNELPDDIQKAIAAVL